MFDLGYHTKHVDTIFARVFGQCLERDTALSRLARNRFAGVSFGGNGFSPFVRNEVRRRSFVGNEL